MDRLYSFVLPAYKSRFLRETIDSILAQTYTIFELIIVNDASPEDVDLIVNSYNDSRIRYYKNKENLGSIDLVNHWNNCLSYSCGEYVILASDDDVYHCEYLNVIHSLTEKYPQVNVFRPRVNYISEFGELIGVEGYIKEWTSKMEFLHAWSNGWIGSGIPYYVFNRKTLMSIGGFVNYPLAWFSDDATVFKLADLGVVSSSEVLFSFRMSGISISTKKNSIESLRKKVAATKKFFADTQYVLNDSQGESDYEHFVVEQTKLIFPKYIEKNKLYGQFFHASFITVVHLLPEIYRLEFVSAKTLMKYFLLYIYRMVFK